MVYCPDDYLLLDGAYANNMNLPIICTHGPDDRIRVCRALYDMGYRRSGCGISLEDDCHDIITLSYAPWITITPHDRIYAYNSLSQAIECRSDWGFTPMNSLTHMLDFMHIRRIMPIRPS